MMMLAGQAALQETGVLVWSVTCPIEQAVTQELGVVVRSISCESVHAATH